MCVRLLLDILKIEMKTLQGLKRDTNINMTYRQKHIDRRRKRTNLTDS